MTELETERRHLALADRHLVEGGDRVSNQAALVGGLRTGDPARPQAEALLSTLIQTLEQWRLHRDIIVQRIAHLEAVAAKNWKC